ncbi:Hsp70 family protein [Amycolatopsis acidiphila]|uniref:Hsp70 family protein n=1 Tax=Amycolatopsis acidiphila TaxID=715473 RepID=A0A558A983_9PSEU|nr:Hsp70 family protein [Amycolatopsis acidiphila]TVT20811.1 Hsp70 family protein [Amycolatopsis acidiphila]UIJ58357.1 Hsp70 family protein [Amycolatopsis acidiphila]GHG93799.1 molecular chaperone Hsp70 [Amycolatopsis acidiphila]
MRILSVDLGTSNTVAVLSAHGMPPRVVEVDGSATMPSAVFAGEDGTLMVGRDAERRARLDPTRFEPNPKRRVDEQTLLLGQDVVPVNEALAAVLRRVLEETTRQLGGEQPDEIRLTHPAEWGPLRRNVLLTAARLSGFRGPVHLVPEPVAAAAHFASFPGRTLAPGQALAVYDLGAGTFDVAVVGATQNGFTVLAEDGLPDLGGLDVDQALMVHVGREVSHRDPQQWQRLLRPESTADRRTRRALQEDVKAAKEALSRHPQTDVPMPEPFTDVLVTRGELEALVRPAMLRSVELLSRTVAAAGLTPDRLVGIYLVGGSSRLPLVGSMIAEKLGVVPASLDQPETAVALGAHHVAGEGISMRTQNVEGQVAGGAVPAPPVPQYAPPQTGFPSGPFQFPAPVNFPSFPAPAEPRRSRKKPVIAAAAVVVVLLAAGLTYLLWPSSSSATTFSAADCAQPGQADAKGFTGCLRQLAGKIADTSQCVPGAGSGDIAPPSGQNLGVLTTCSAPALAGAQITYVHGTSAAALKEYTDRLLSSVGGDQVQAPWKGNGLTGSYSSAGSRTSAVLVFTVADRPLAGVVYQKAGSGQTTSTASQLADYFERTVQPGT